MAWASTAPFLCGAAGNLIGGTVSDLLVRTRGLKLGRRLIGCLGLGVSGCMMLLASQTESKLLTVVFLSIGYGAMDCMLPVAWAVCLDVGGKYAGAVSGSMK